MENSIILNRINAVLAQIGEKAKFATEQDQQRSLRQLEKVNGLLVTDKKVILLDSKIIKQIVYDHFTHNRHKYIVIASLNILDTAQIFRIAESYGFPAKNVRVELLDADRKKFPIEVCLNLNCRAVLLGGIKHKMKGVEGDSPVNILREHCLILYELKNRSRLKITTSNLRIGLQYVASQIAHRYHFSGEPTFSNENEEKRIAVSV